MILKEAIKTLAARHAPDFIKIRQHIHAHPELSYQEFETSRYIQQHLSGMGIPFQIMATTGIVAQIKGRNPEKRVVALRGDMDALPIKEENDIPYKSRHEGLMHACGHDVHTTCLLGAAKILDETKDQWEGTVKLIFQPGEEKNPGGASLMIKEGVLENPRPQAIFALHVHPGLEVGKLSFRGGKIMASADEIYMTIRAKGGHAASPHLTADPILVASQMIIALQQVISRNRNPFIPSVLSITSIQGGHTTNVIPSEVKLMGTFRSMDETWRYEAHELIRKTATGIVEGMGATLDLVFDIGYPCVYNNEALNEKTKMLGEAYMGKENVEETELRMGAEDFGYYSQQIPGCFFRLGAGNAKKGITSGVHTPTFNIDESAIEIGMGMMAMIATNIEL
ncbi:MAG: amidohydrolase [Terrimonas sp.]|nr:amidohydrolase [Terrimonas sp.]